MSALPWQQSNLSESQEPQQNSINSSASPLRLVTNAVLTEKMPYAQILSYLVPHTSDSGGVKDSDLYNTLVENTGSSGSSNKLSFRSDDEPRNIISHEHFKTKPQQSFFTSLQAWEGIVTQVMDNAFLARLIDLTHTGVDEEAEFPIDEISEEDKALITPGAIFYWDIGYHTSYSGQRTRKSLIRFRRLPAWTQKEIEAAQREAERIGKAFGWQ
jgi:hypothetical protein